MSLKVSASEVYSLYSTVPAGYHYIGIQFYDCLYTSPHASHWLAIRNMYYEIVGYVLTCGNYEHPCTITRVYFKLCMAVWILNPWECIMDFSFKRGDLSRIRREKVLIGWLIVDLWMCIETVQSLPLHHIYLTLNTLICLFVCLFVFARGTRINHLAHTRFMSIY